MSSSQAIDDCFGPVEILAPLEGRELDAMSRTLQIAKSKALTMSTSGGEDSVRVSSKRRFRTAPGQGTRSSVRDETS